MSGEEKKKEFNPVTETFKMVVQTYFTSIADFLHQCKVDGLTLEQTAELFDRYVKKTLKDLEQL